MLVDEQEERAPALRRRIATVAGVVVLALFGAYGVGAGLVYNELTAVTGHCRSDVASNSPQHFGPGHEGFDPAPWFMPPPEAVTFPSRDASLTISGWFIAGGDPNAPAVVVVHGHNGCKREPSVLVPAGMLHRSGFAVLLIDLRDHGDSSYEDGRFAGGTEEYRDALGAWDWLQSAKGLRASRIGLFGVSLGAATVLIATGEEPRVAATWEDSSFANIEDAIRAELARSQKPTFLEPAAVFIPRLMSGDDLLSHSPLDAVHKLHGRPLFIAHGDADERLSVTYAYDLEAAIEEDGGRAEMWIVPGAHHTEAMFLYPDEYERRLTAFFRSTIGR
jgi:dipeptidyl aminopeptidase/acylaminoacyl peptidase